MYTDFSVQGFRGLGDLELDRLTLVTVITGRNGVGKSSLLEALYLHACGPTAGINALMTLRPMRGLVPVATDTQGRLAPPWEPFFPVEWPEREAHLTGSVGGVVRDVTLARQDAAGEVRLTGTDSPARGMSSPAGLLVRSPSSEPAQEYETTVTVMPGGGVQVLTSPDDARPVSEVRIVRGPGAVDVPSAFSDLRRRGRDDILVRALHVIDPRIAGVELLVADGQNALHARLDSGGLMPFTSLGDGVNAVLTHVLSMTATTGGLVLVDELERGLHHTVFTDVWAALVTLARETGTQLVVTTHSDECVAGAARALADDLDLLTLVRLRRADGDLDADPRQSVKAVTYVGQEVLDAVDLRVEVR